MEEIQVIAKRIKDNGGELYLVGGAVRDSILGREIQDEDYCVTGISKETFASLFPEAKWIGKSFGVFELNHREYAIARKESKKGVGHKEFEIEMNKDITIEEDLERRDLTINGMAKKVLTGEIIDPFEGRKDIELHRLRAIGSHFGEDPLRVYRVARFAANLEFEVDKNTILYMKEMVNELPYLSKERVWEEFRKAMKSDRPSIFFDVLRQIDALKIHFKEIEDLIGSLQPAKYHPEGDSYVHTMQVLDKASRKTDDERIRFAALVHDLGKGTTPKEMYPHHYGHDERGIPLVEKLGKRIGVPNEWIEYGQIAAKEHMLGGIFGKMTPAKQVSFIERVQRSKIGLDGLQIVVDSDRTGRGNYTETEEESYNSRFLNIGKQCFQEINAKTIQQKYGNIKGKQFGEYLHQERIRWIKENYKRECL